MTHGQPPGDTSVADGYGDGEPPITTSEALGGSKVNISATNEIQQLKFARCRHEVNP